jgi:hypothetical protein
MTFVVRGRPPGESAVAEDPVEVGHEGHRGLAGEQPVGAAVREDETIRRAAADIVLVQPVRRERELGGPDW